MTNLEDVSQKKVCWRNLVAKIVVRTTQVCVSPPWYSNELTHQDVAVALRPAPEEGSQATVIKMEQNKRAL